MRAFMFFSSSVFYLLSKQGLLFWGALRKACEDEQSDQKITRDLQRPKEKVKNVGKCFSPALLLLRYPSEIRLDESFLFRLDLYLSNTFLPVVL